MGRWLEQQSGGQQPVVGRWQAAQGGNYQQPEPTPAPAEIDEGLASRIGATVLRLVQGQTGGRANKLPRFPVNPAEAPPVFSEIGSALGRTAGKAINVLPRAALGAQMEAAKGVGRVVGKDINPEYTPGNLFSKFVFGGDPVKPLSQMQAPGYLQGPQSFPVSKYVVQPTTTSGLRIASAVGEAVSPGLGRDGEITFDPKKMGYFAQVLLGDKEIRSAVREGEELVESLGVEGRKKTVIGAPLGLVFAGLDMIPIGAAGEKASVKAMEQIAKTDGVADIVKLLRPLMRGSDEALQGTAAVLSKTKSVPEVRAVMARVPLAKQAEEAINLGKTADEFVESAQIDDLIPFAQGSTISKSTDVEKVAEDLRQEARTVYEAIQKNSEEIVAQTKKAPEMAPIEAKAAEGSARTYGRTVNLNEPDDVDYLGTILGKERAEQLKAGDYTHYRNPDNTLKYWEDYAQVNIIDEPPKTIESKLKGRVKSYSLSDNVLYHGTSAQSKSAILNEGFRVGSELPENAYRGGGYGALQDSISFSTDRNIAKTFSEVSTDGAVLEAKLKKGTTVVRIDGIDHAEELNEYAPFLRKNGIDAVYIDGEKEIVVLDPSSIEGVKQADLDETARLMPEVSTPKPKKVAPYKALPGTESPAEVTRGEDVMLRERLRAEARGAKAGMREGKKVGKETERSRWMAKQERQAEKAARQKAVQDIKQSVVKGIEISRRKELSRIKSDIGYVKKIGEFNQQAVNDAKRSLNITKPINKLSRKEAKELRAELSKRLEFKQTRGFRVGEPKKKPVKLTQEFYDSLTAPQKTVKERAATTVREAKKGVRAWDEKWLKPLSSRLRDISPRLRGRLIEHEKNTLTKISSRLHEIEPSVKKLRKAIEPGSDAHFRLKVAQLNGDGEQVRKIFEENGLGDEYAKIRSILDELHTEAKEVGMDIGYVEEYWSRYIDDVDGLQEYFYGTEAWPLVKKAYKEKELELGRPLRKDERVQIMQTLLRGYQGPGRISLSLPGAAKRRVIDYIDPKMSEFFADPTEVLPRYIEMMTEQVEMRRLWGKRLKEDGYLDVSETISNYVDDLMVKGEIDESQVQELKTILQARFGEYGEMWKGFGAFRTATYASLLGNPINAVTQLQDLAFSLYESPRETIPAFIRAIFKQNKLRKEDIGITEIARDIQDARGGAKFLNRVMKISGFQHIDSLGKETLINSAISKYMRIAEKNADELPLAKFNDLVGGDDERLVKLIDDLKKGYISDDVKLVAFDELSKKQPITKLEMPEKYLTNPTARMLYMLKTYNIKQLDVFRQEVFSLFKENPKQAMKNMVKLSTALVMLGATTEEIKNFIMGREVDFSDAVSNNILKLFMLDRYSVSNIARDGLYETAISQVIPPGQIIDDFVRDLDTAATDYDPTDINKYRSIKNIPVGGKLYYWWFGRGMTSNEDREERELPEKIMNELDDAKTPEERGAIIKGYADAGLLTDSVKKRIVTLKKDQKLSKREISLKNAKNEDKAAFIDKELRKMDAEDRGAYIQDLTEKGILTKSVKDAIIELNK